MQKNIFQYLVLKRNLNRINLFKNNAVAQLTLNAKTLPASSH